MNNIEEIINLCVRSYKECVADGVVNEDDTKEYVLKELTNLLTQQREQSYDSGVKSCIQTIEGYFKGLIVIPDPQKTKESLIGYLYSELSQQREKGKE